MTITEMFATLSDTLDGTVVTGGDAGFDDARTGYQRGAPHAPAAVVSAASRADIVTAVRFAAEHSLPVAVRASGHGHGAALTDGVLIATGAVHGVTVDAAARTAFVEAGATGQQVIDAAAEHGLAPLTGSAPGVGAVSYTIGGGIGLLGRRFGYAADHLVRAELVTADGTVHVVGQASTGTDAALFRALRGGGGGIGVVTWIEIGLEPLPAIAGGSLMFAVDDLPDVLERWRDWTRGVPRELTSGASMLVFPDLPALPETWRGRQLASVQVAWCGDPDVLDSWLAPWRELGPIHDTVRTLPFTESASVFDEPDRPHAYRSQNRLVTDLDSGALRSLTAGTGPDAPTMCVVGLRHLGGAFADEPDAPSSVGHREAQYSLTVLSPIEELDGEALRDLHEAQLASFDAATVGRALNFSYGPQSDEQIRDGFDPAVFAQLVELQRRVDPDHRIRANHPLPR